MRHEKLKMESFMTCKWFSPAIHAKDLDASAPQFW